LPKQGIHVWAAENQWRSVTWGAVIATSQHSRRLKQLFSLQAHKRSLLVRS
jgi:hypothetical protein